MVRRFLLVCLLGWITSPGRATTTSPAPSSAELEARNFLEDFNKLCLVDRGLFYNAEWGYKTNITDYNEQEMIKQQVNSSKFDREWREEALKINETGLSEDTRRQLHLIKKIGISALPDDQSAELRAAIAEMQGIYSTAKVCLGKKGCLDLEPGLTRLMANSRDYDELLAAWKGWRDATGPKMRETYPRFVQLSNAAVRSLGYEDAGAEWRSDYETDTLEEDLLALLNQILPLYEQLHAFVRKRLMDKYGAGKFPASGHIPAHLLGDMWAQTWGNIEDIVKLFKDKPSLDVTDEIVKQNYTVMRMFRTAEDFFVSLGLENMTNIFWNKSMLRRPSDGREVECHASAEDFYGDQDFRIKMCTDITHQSLEIIHHEMGHIEYFMQYRHQPCVYRDGANPGFHEAVGDLMSLSAQTPEHLNKINLLFQPMTDQTSDLNFLMRVALEKVAFLPFGYLMDLWRYSVFRGKTSPYDYNTHWWNARCRYQGVSSPVPRSEEDFDPGAKYHIAANVEYARYFVSNIIQFQFHKAACTEAGHKGPLHRCDIYNNTAAGKLISDMLKMGLSRPWPEAMKNITGQEKMDAGPLLEYFQPLYDILKQVNGNNYGWRPTCPTTEELAPKTSCPQGNAGATIQYSLFVLLFISSIKFLF